MQAGKEKNRMLKRFKTKAQALVAIDDAPALEGGLRLGFFVRTTSRHTLYAEELWHEGKGRTCVDCIGEDWFSNIRIVTLSQLTLKSLTRIYNHVIEN